MRIVPLAAVLLAAYLSPAPACAELKVLTPSRYVEWLHARRPQPSLLLLWSINCPTCLQDMRTFSELHTRYPALNMIMASVDGPTASEQITDYLAQYELDDLEHWHFQVAHDPSLHQAIDPAWHGEVPRLYWFDHTGRRASMTGSVSLEDLQAWLIKHGATLEKNQH